jgi:hypothetical protein
MSQLSATRTLCTRMSNAANDLYVLSRIGPRDRGMSDPISKYLGKEEPKQSECSMDFNQRKGQRTKHQHSHSWTNENRK